MCIHTQDNFHSIKCGNLVFSALISISTNISFRNVNQHVSIRNGPTAGLYFRWSMRGSHKFCNSTLPPVSPCFYARFRRVMQFSYFPFCLTLTDYVYFSFVGIRFHVHYTRRRCHMSSILSSLVVHKQQQQQKMATTSKL